MQMWVQAAADTVLGGGGVTLCCVKRVPAGLWRRGGVGGISKFITDLGNCQEKNK